MTCKEKQKFRLTEIGRVPEEWSVVKLGSVSEKIFTGRDPSGGKLAHAKELTGHRLIRSAEVFDGFLDSDMISHIDEKTAEIVKSAEVTNGDVLLNQLGDGITFARSCVVPVITYKAYVTRSVGVIHVNKKRLNPFFLNAYLVLPRTKQYIESFNSGSSRRAIDGGKMKQFLIPLPNRAEQDSVAQFYRNIQSRIELFKEQNKTLEAFGKAFFKRWFVDFEFPNEEGKPYKSSGGEMVDSELGEIPKGWVIQEISQFGEVVCGKTPSTTNKENFGGDIPFITIPDMRDRIFITNTERSLSKKGAQTQLKKELPTFSVCVSCIATPGLVSITYLPSHTNQQINSIVLVGKYLPFYLYFSLKRISRQIILQGSGGTATLNLNKEDFSKIMMIKPSDGILRKYHDFISPFFLQILNNQLEQSTLSEVRNFLLPRLMSGVIRVKVSESVNS